MDMDEVDARFDTFLDVVGGALRSDTQRASFARYTVGLLSDAERKSLEPLAARSRPDAAGAEHKAFCYFVSQAPWNDRAVRRAASAWALWGANTESAVRVSIIDDTGLLKQGTHSVGVARQYTGSAGKITNCQVAVTLAVATDHDTVPVDVALYLPKEWTDDRARCEKAGIPDSVEFKSKADLAIEMLRSARADGVPLGDVVLSDADYGRCSAFRAAVRELGLHYGVAVYSSQRVWDEDGIWTEPKTVAEVARWVRFRRLSWRMGSGGEELTARFAFLRVHPASGSTEPDGSEPAQWLILEWRDGEEAPAHFYLCTLGARTPKRQLVHIVKERWRTERMYEDLKGEVGFDHFEGRSWIGWHHHLSVVLSCYALLVGERCVAFPPGATRIATTGSNRNAA